MSDEIDWAHEAQRLNCKVAAILDDSDKKKIAEFLRETYERGLRADRDGLDPYEVRQLAPNVWQTAR